MTEHRDYLAPPLDARDLHPDPLEQFRRWFDDARAGGLVEPEAMLVSTLGEHGFPQTRYVLLRGLDERGFAFFTNYDSAKVRELTAHPQVGLTFGWLAQHRSVRVTGIAERLPDAESDAYFTSRPRGSRLGAWASPQSAVIASREELDARVAEVEARFAGVEDVPRPPGWGGILVRPDRLPVLEGPART